VQIATYWEIDENMPILFKAPDQLVNTFDPH
jgi:hypothetical protein